MNQKLIILVGVSGSGKTTFAKQYIKENPGTVRVNRDDMRRQVLGELTQDYYSKKNSSVRGKLEKHITVVQNEMIRYWLLQGFDVIADNTHLRRDDVANYIQNFSYLADICIKPITVDPIVAKHRILSRDGIRTDLHYIDRQVKEYRSLEILETPGDPQLGILIPKREPPVAQYDYSLPNCYLCDIDGTVADCTGIRSPYDGEKLHLDKPISPTRELLNIINCAEFNAPYIIYLSGREDKWKAKTIDWLRINDFPFHDKIYMRKTGDTRKDCVVKEEIIREHILGKYNILGVFDDRYQVTDHLRNNMGLFVFQVNQQRKIF